tara:strand:- start:337 stop:798 length:462 start_codon:yes stop_codon:yes gene_type:complete
MYKKLGYYPKPNNDKETFLEIALLIAISIVLFSTFYGNDGSPPPSPSISPETFYENPIHAWQTLDNKGGECVKVRYLVERDNTQLYMLNRDGKVVHKQPLQLSPHKDGRERIETYVWKLYRTEWTDKIPPGQYLIIVGTSYDRRGVNQEITIL